MDERTGPPDPAPSPGESTSRRRSRFVRLLHGTGVVWVWTLGLGVTIVGLAVLGVVWLSRQPSGNRLTFALANHALAQNTNLRLSARRSLIVDHGAALVEPTIEIVDSLGVRHPWIVARRARLLTSWWGLLSRRPGELYLTLDAPVVTMHRDERGQWLLPRTTGHGKGGGGGALGIDFVIQDGLVRVREPARFDTLAKDIDATLRVHGAGGTWDLAVGRLVTYLPGPRLQVRKADGRARLADDRLDLDHVRVRTDSGWIQARGGGSVGGQASFEGDLTAGEWTWHGLARALRQPSLDVSGGFAGAAHLTYDRGVLTLSDGAADVLWRDEPARVQFAGAWRAGRLHLASSDVRWRGSEYRGAFDLVPQSGAWRLAGRVTDLELADLPRAWPMPPLDSLLTSGDVTLAGDKKGYAGTVARGRAAWRGQVLDSLAGTWAYAGGVQTIDARARAAGGSVSARGTLSAHALDARVAAAGVAGEEISPRLWRLVGISPAPRAGRLESFEARLAGAPQQPTFDGRARVTGFERPPIAVGSANLVLAGNLGRAYRVTASLAGGPARAGVARADSAAARVVLAPGRIEVPRFRAVRAESVLVLQGFATRAGDAWSVQLDSLRWQDGERLALAAQGPVRFRVDDTGAIDLAPVRVVSSAGALTAQGRWGGESGTSDLALDLESLDLEGLLGPVATERQIEGVLSGTARYRGPGRHGTWDVNLSGTGLRYGAQRAQHLAVQGQFADDDWRIAQLDLDTGRGRLHVTGDIDWPAPPPWGRPTADWNRALADAPRWQGTLSTDSLALAQVSEFVPQAGGWRGALTLTANFSGRPTAPAFSAQGRLAAPGWGQASLGDVDLALDYHDDVLTVDRFAVVGPDSLSPSVRGTMPLRLGWGVPSADRLPDRPMDLQLVAHRLDLGLAPLLVPQIAEATGRADVTVRVTGTPKHPHADGTLLVSDGVVRPANREEVLTGVQGRIALTGNELRVDSFEARQGRRGRVVVRPGGVAHLKEMRIADYAFSVTATNFTAFSSGEYVVELNGGFDVRNGADLGGVAPIPHITGRATVIEGTFLTNFGDPAAQAGYVGPTVQPAWTYDVQVEARNNLWWRPPDANIEGRLTDFEMVQTLDQFLMLGEIDAVRGRYYFLGNQFDVQSGTLFFDRAHPLNPTVDATLTTQVALPASVPSAAADRKSQQLETVTIAVSGRVAAPNIGMTSEPDALAPGDIASLLTAGQLQSGSNPATIAGQAAGTYLFRQIARNPALQPFLSGVEIGTVEERPYDPSQANSPAPGTGTLTTSQQTVMATVGMSRYLTRDLLVRYSQFVGDLSQVQRVDYQDLAAEYRINRLLFLQGQVTKRRGSLLPQDETLYNLDVRARYEY